MQATESRSMMPSMKASIGDAASAPSPEAALRSLLAEHDALLIEDCPSPDAWGWCGRVFGRLTAIFPAGQDAALTLRMAQDFIAHQGSAIPV